MSVAAEVHEDAVGSLVLLQATRVVVQLKRAWVRDAERVEQVGQVDLVEHLRPSGPAKLPEGASPMRPSSVAERKSKSSGMSGCIL